jgi:hypothetical protein
MPYKRKYNKRSKRRRRSKNYTTGQLKNVISDRQLVKMRYCDTVTINPGIGGTPATHIFSANGIYDPDITAIGHQPIGFDQWMNFYDHYTVVGAKINVNFTNHNTGDSYVCGVHLDDDVTVIGNANSLREQKSNYTYLNRAGESSSMRQLSQKCSVKKYLGKSNLVDSDECKGTTSANPAEQVYFHVWCAPLDGTSDEGDLRCNVQIDYLVLLTEPKNLSES